MAFFEAYKKKTPARKNNAEALRYNLKHYENSFLSFVAFGVNVYVLKAKIVLVHCTFAHANA